MAELYERIAAKKFSEAGPDYPFRRGWNAALDFVVKQMRATCDEPQDEEMAE